jgi:AcrR family transcriptional regulator
MLQIAERSGLGQSSLYYWFRRKELIVAEILQQANRMPLAYAHGLRDEGDDADVQLWCLVRFDVLTLCDFPLEITEIHRLSERDPATFETYWSERRMLTDAVAALVNGGIEVDAHLCALSVLAGDESVQNWYVGTRASVRGVRDAKAASYDPETIAQYMADQTVRGLLVRAAQLERVRGRALTRKAAPAT